jgi:hypothetical protein
MGKIVPVNSVTMNGIGNTWIIFQKSDDGVAWTTFYECYVYGEYTRTFADVKTRYIRVTSNDNDPFNKIVIRIGNMIEFTNTPANGAVITASWNTNIPPKTSDYSYDSSIAVDWN